MSRMTGEDELEELDEDSLHNSEVLPTRRPHPIIIAAGLTARGGVLWLPVAGLLALSGKEKAAKRALTAAAVAMPLGHLISLAVPRRRPQVATMPAREALPEHPDSSSFPSKHAVTAAAFGTATALTDRDAGLAVTPLVLLVAYSRLRTRVHWPSDVLGGLAIGALVALAQAGIGRSARARATACRLAAIVRPVFSDHS
ncbi:undecaprenyl-diphosphatase [Lentzea flaviverrucosa]|uniref:Undecaprenyl-diphosphatase n=2 Tax=Lentzea flaviverrucosa TaxID=200379 RepID=A0A1H9XXB7_9PSEU|nr:undecaprenyl-diphosphatase [Lentzea flaviverrucosa]SES50781.1 undecaprenyl-diphosphatase [Lentzea flaviverrucosa]